MSEFMEGKEDTLGYTRSGEKGSLSESHWSKFDEFSKQLEHQTYKIEFPAYADDLRYAFNNSTRRELLDILQAERGELRAFRDLNSNRANALEKDLVRMLEDKGPMETAERLVRTAVDELETEGSVSYTHLTLPPKA